MGVEWDSPNIDLHPFLSTLSMDNTLLNLSWAVKKPVESHTRLVPHRRLRSPFRIRLVQKAVVEEGKRLLDGGGGGTCP